VVGRRRRRRSEGGGGRRREGGGVVLVHICGVQEGEITSIWVIIPPSLSDDSSSSLLLLLLLLPSLALSPLPSPPLIPLTPPSPPFLPPSLLLLQDDKSKLWQPRDSSRPSSPTKPNKAHPIPPSSSALSLATPSVFLVTLFPIREI